MQTNLVKMAAVALVITACGGSKTETTNTAAPEPKVVLADQLMMSTLWMQKSQEAGFLKRQAYELASMKLDENIRKGIAKKPLAVILDLDETVLDNSPYEARLILKGQGYNPASWDRWVNEAQADAVPGAKEFLEKVNRLGIEIFYISNRNESHMQATIENMQRLELPYADPEHIFLREEENSSKTQRRERVRDGHKVVLLVGDQMSDFSEEPVLQEDAVQDGYVSPLLDSANAYFVLLPNPMYGSFESDIYGNQRDLQGGAKNQYRRKALDPKKDMAR